MTAAIDLIYVVRPNAGWMCAMVDLRDGAGPAMLGPVPAEGAFEQLGELLAAGLPERFPDERAAASWLTLVHFINLARGSNAVGQDYPMAGGRATGRN